MKKHNYDQHSKIILGNIILPISQYTKTTVFFCDCISASFYPSHREIISAIRFLDLSAAIEYLSLIAHTGMFKEFTVKLKNELYHALITESEKYDSIIISSAYTLTDLFCPFLFNHINESYDIFECKTLPENEVILFSSKELQVYHLDKYDIRKSKEVFYISYYQDWIISKSSHFCIIKSKFT